MQIRPIRKDYAGLAVAGKEQKQVQLLKRVADTIRDLERLREQGKELDMRICYGIIFQDEQKTFFGASAPSSPDVRITFCAVNPGPVGAYIQGWKT